MCGFKILNMSLNIIFTWWNKQTFGTFLKTLFYGIYVGQDELGNRYYKSKKIKDGVIKLIKLRLRKLPQIGIYGYTIL